MEVCDSSPPLIPSYLIPSYLMTRRDAIKSSALFLGYAATAGAFAQIFTACQNEPKAAAGAAGGFFNACLEILNPGFRPRRTGFGFGRTTRFSAAITTSTARR